MIKLEQLAVTQCGFRNEAQIQEMISFVANGGIFNADSLSTYSNGKDLRLINIAMFEDGREFIHDGHHRVAAIYLGGRRYLHDSEYVVIQWKYGDYIEVNFEVRWVTPFDPRIKVRIPDHEEYKKWIFKNREHCGEASALKTIELRHDTYAMPRRVLSIQDLLSSTYGRSKDLQDS